MIFVNDSILLVASESYSYGSFADVLLTYLNINTLETEEFVFLSPNNVQVIKLLVTESNKLLVVSNFNSEDGETRGFQIYKTDFFSNVAFENFVVPYTLQTEFRDATMANNGLIVVAGTFFPENNLYGETLATLIDTNGVFITDIKSPDNDNFAYPINAVKYLQNDVCIYAGASTFLNFNITRGAFYTSNGLIYYDDGRVFDGNVYDEFKDITSTSDGGFIAVGNSKTFGPGLFGALIVKINSELNFTLNVVTSIDEQISTEDNNFKIYPNPVSDILYFEHQLSTSIEKIRIFDVKGNLIQSINNNEATTIDVSQLTNGVYFISFETKDKQILIRKFIKK
jgi:hypothetical protein